jgi:AcrR family transcriptional regulator
MPARFQEAQLERLRTALLAAAERAFVERGFEATSVADLTSAVGISKGAFYRFFPTKDDLFLEVQGAVETRCKARLRAAVARARDSGADELAVFFDAVGRNLEEEPFLVLLADPTFVRRLLARVAPERLASHRADDAAFYGTLFDDWARRGAAGALSREDLHALLLTRFVLRQNRDVFGDAYASAIELLRRAIAHRAR